MSARAEARAKLASSQYWLFWGETLAAEADEVERCLGWDASAKRATARHHFRRAWEEFVDALAIARRLTGERAAVCELRRVA